MVLVRLESGSVKAKREILISFRIKEVRRKPQIQVLGSDVDIFSCRRRFIWNYKRRHQAADDHQIIKQITEFRGNIKVGLSHQL